MNVLKNGSGMTSKATIPLWQNNILPIDVYEGGGHAGGRGGGGERMATVCIASRIDFLTIFVSFMLCCFSEELVLLGVRFCLLKGDTAVK